MPRPYRRKITQPAEDGTKARIIQASCELLMSDKGFAGFTVEAVAKQANVARATVYYQFGSKSGLLDAVLDDIAVRAAAIPFDVVTSHAGNPDALEEIVAAIAAFWSAEREVTRRFYGLAALDPDVKRSVTARDEERQAGIRAVIAGHLRREGRWSQQAEEEGSAIAYALLRFETFDTLAQNKPLESVIPIIIRLIRSALADYAEPN